MRTITVLGLGVEMSKLITHCFDRFPDRQKLFAGGAVAESIMKLHGNIPDHIQPNDLDVFIPDLGPGNWLGEYTWATNACPLNYSLGKSAVRKISFLSSARDGFVNWIELETDHIVISDLLDSFDLDVCQAVYEPGGGDTVHVTEAFLHSARSRSITLNPLVVMDKRIAKRIPKKLTRYGW